MRWILLSLILTFAPLAQATSSVTAELVRMPPTTLPGTCLTGDLRNDTNDANKLKLCIANVWSSIGGGTSWGSITGTLSSQTDLQTELNLLAPLASPTFTGSVTAPTFVGNLTGNVTGNVSGSSGSTTGNAATVTTNANLTGVITSIGNATSITSQTGTGTKFVVDTSPVLVTPNLGTPSALVGTNISGTGASFTAGHVTTNANLTGPVTSVGNATTIIAASVTNAMLAGSIAASNLVGSDIATVGTIASGTWNGTAIDAAHGGTSVSNSGTLTFSGTASVTGANTGDVSLTGVGSTPNANGASLTGQVLNLQAADGTNPGALTAIAQTIGGVKTFSAQPIMSTLTASQVVTTDGSKGLTSLAFSASAAATSLAERDANVTLAARRFQPTESITATAAGTTTLVASSNGVQIFTGSTTQNLVMPVVTTLGVTSQFEIHNRSTGVVTVQSSGGNTIKAMEAGSTLHLTLTVNTADTTAAPWDVAYNIDGVLPIADGGTNNGALGVDAGGVYYSDGTKIVNLAHGSSGNVLTSGGTGAPTWTSPLVNPMTTGGDIIYGGAAGAATRLANGTAGQFLKSAGTTAAPTWFTIAGRTQQQFIVTGTAAGQIFTITSATPVAGDTYTNNANTYTVLGPVTATTIVYMSGTGSPTASGTLTRASGTGPATLTFSAAQALATYTAPANVKALNVYLVGGGGGGGGAATAASSAGAGGGGGGGGGCIQYITSPSATYYYAIATGGGGGAAGNNIGTAGGITFFLNSFSVPAQSSGGAGGGGSGAASTPIAGGAGGGQGIGSNCTVNLRGQPGATGLILSGSAEISGYGGEGAIFGTRAAGNTSSTSAGLGGFFAGSGGSGGSLISAGVAQAGGAGSAGFILVDESY